MKAQTKAIVASIVVVALALSAVSGITYSWFSDTDSAEINVKSATVDVELTQSLGTTTGTGTVGADGNNITLSGVAANFIYNGEFEIKNKSDIDIVYRIYIQVPSTVTDTNVLSNVLVGADESNLAPLKNATIVGEGYGIILKDWTTWNNVTKDTPIDGEYVLKTTNLFSTSGAEIPLKLVVEAHQGDYPATSSDAGSTVIGAPVASVAAETDGGVDGVKTVLSFDGKAAEAAYGKTLTVKSIPTPTSSSGIVTVSLEFTDGTTTFNGGSVDVTVIVPGITYSPSDISIVYTGAGSGPTLVSYVYNATDNSLSVTFRTTHFSEYTVKIGNTDVKTAEDLKTALENGMPVRLGADIVFTEKVDNENNANICIPAGVSSVLDLNGKTITFSPNKWHDDHPESTGKSVGDSSCNGAWGIKVKGELTIIGTGTLNGASNCDCVTVGTADDAAKLTIRSGTYVNGGKGGNIYNFGGDIEIYGGEFTNGDTEEGYGYLLNIQNSKDSAKITVYGGTFVGYDPATGDDVIEGSFVAEGYVSKKIGDTETYIVELAKQDEVVSNLKDTTTEQVEIPEGTIQIENGDIPNENGSVTKKIVGQGRDVSKLNWNEKTKHEGGLLIYARGTTMVLEDLTLIMPDHGDYNGFVSSEITFKNCIIEGTITLYGKVTFENCIFNVTGNRYCVWTWGAETVTFNNCVFNTDGKAILLYGMDNKERDIDTELNITNCTFNDNGSITGKAAVEIGYDGRTRTEYASTYVLKITNAVVNGFDINDDNPELPGTTLWGNKNNMGADHLSVFIDGMKVTLNQTT